MEIVYSPHFRRAYKKLPAKIKLLAEDREQIFRANWKESSLDTHKLKGTLEGFWAFSINNNFRIIFDFDGEYVRFHDVGDHDIYGR